jgi:hypothetical protein
MLEITASIYMPLLGYLACGRNDGSIVIIPAVEAITLQLLENGRSKGRCITGILIPSPSSDCHLAIRFWFKSNHLCARI